MSNYNRKTSETSLFLARKSFGELFALRTENIPITATWTRNHRIWVEYRSRLVDKSYLVLKDAITELEGGYV